MSVTRASSTTTSRDVTGMRHHDARAVADRSSVSMSSRDERSQTESAPVATGRMGAAEALGLQQRLDDVTHLAHILEQQGRWAGSSANSRPSRRRDSGDRSSWLMPSSSCRLASSMPWTSAAM